MSRSTDCPVLVEFVGYAWEPSVARITLARAESVFRHIGAGNFMSDVAAPRVIRHGAEQVSSVNIDGYNAELRSEDGFVGDRASKRAFDAILDEWRERMRKLDDEDPLGEKPTEEIGKKKLDKILAGDDLEAAALVHGAVEEFAQELATVVRRFLRLKSWRDTQRIVVGGGLRASRVGELAIARASVLLKADGH